jgi:hypothetical protein
MTHKQNVLVACTIEAGAFSGERVFRLTLADGQTEYSGVAPAHYCFTKDQQPLGRDQPPQGQRIDGYIEAFLVSNGGDEAMVEFPDGEAVRVKLGQVPYRQDRDRKLQYVPL